MAAWSYTAFEYDSGFFVICLQMWLFFIALVLLDFSSWSLIASYLSLFFLSHELYWWKWRRSDGRIVILFGRVILSVAQRLHEEIWYARCRQWWFLCLDFLLINFDPICLDTEPQTFDVFLAICGQSRRLWRGAWTAAMNIFMRQSDCLKLHAISELNPLNLFQEIFEKGRFRWKLLDLIF